MFYDTIHVLHVFNVYIILSSIRGSESKVLTYAISIKGVFGQTLTKVKTNKKNKTTKNKNKQTKKNQEGK